MLSRGYSLLLLAVSCVMTLTSALNIIVRPCEDRTDNLGVLATGLDCSQGALIASGFACRSGQCVTPETKYCLSENLDVDQLIPMTKNYLGTLTECTSIANGKYRTKEYN
ncbi:hypothetical protein BGX23_003772 [Mortierella sp. AD031]|nr:hypothetical protein BGX23_003772 [Mortierella sp. AD031]